jgi:o-succinylbenzoate---CoA ligase
VSPLGKLTYGKLAAAASRNRAAGQVLVAPGPHLESIVELMTVPDAGRQMIVLDPRLPAEEQSRRRAAARVARDREAAMVLFTSGTTGPAKAVRLTTGNWDAAVTASATHLRHGPDDVWLAAMPLHHVGGLSILYRTAYVGASVRWIPEFSAAAVVEALRSGVTMASLVPTMLRRVLDLDEGDYRGLRAVLVGGGSIPPGLLEEAHARGIPALPTYGMTETCAQVATLRPGSSPRHVAHLLPGIEARIGSDQRIELRGRQISPGYADEDDRAPDEWFRTPDRGGLDTDGALRILGRVDQVIVSGGENVEPRRVEEVILSHPGVRLAAVAGIPDPEWGEKVVAVYEGEVDPVPLQTWVHERLAPYEVPRMWRRVPAVPLNAAGKPDPERVRELFES